MHNPNYRESEVTEQKYNGGNYTPHNYGAPEFEITKPLDKISNIPSEKTEICLPNVNKNNFIQTRKFEWTSIYGKLKQRRIHILFTARRLPNTSNKSRIYIE